MNGYWSIGVPVSPQIVDEDMPLLKAIQMPDGVLLREAEVVVNGRVWTWRFTEVIGEFGVGSNDE